VRDASAYYQRVKRLFDERGTGAGNPEETRHLITRAYDHILVAETSCNFYWGSRWVHRSFDALEQAYHLLDTAVSLLPK
jgi:alpha-amylase/alpha-mannosidase (GH57 family)